MCSLSAADHCDIHGYLAPQDLVRLSCRAKFTIFEPLAEYRTLCPRVLLVCSGEHMHPIPLPTKTPARIRQQIIDLLDSIKHDLPDMTPRRFLRHRVLESKLQELLPTHTFPTLSDLHVSLANREHIRSYIREAQERHFPHGTGWEGMPRTYFSSESRAHESADKAWHT